MSHHRLGIFTLSVLAVGCGGDNREQQTTAAASITLGNGDTGSETGGPTSTGVSPGESAAGGNTTSTPVDDSAGDGPKFDVMGADTTGGLPECAPHEKDTTLTGTVYGPNGILPVSGALVYLSSDPPAGIPQGVYCPDCTPLGCDDDNGLTNADGSFSVDVASGSDKYLVVQKGQFMRVTQLDVPSGDVGVSAALTTLPDHNDPDNGEYIPLIAVGNATYDRLEDALGKFGLGDTSISALEERLVPGTESFDLWDNGIDPTTEGFASPGSFAELVSNPEALAQYHIIFVPCSTDDYVSALSVPANVQNIREWVAAGGRWYVADWSNEWLQMVFPEYQNLAGWSGVTGSADLSAYDSLADVLDDGLREWLEALPAALKDINPLNDEPHPTLFTLPQVLTVDNWSGISAILPVIVDDGMGGTVNVGHKVWLQGPGGEPAGVHPLTVTGQFGCGKVQFTSYHAAEFFDYVGLSPQELVLIYTILEIGVCQEPLPPPQG